LYHSLEQNSLKSVKHFLKIEFYKI